MCSSDSRDQIIIALSPSRETTLAGPTFNARSASTEMHPHLFNFALFPRASPDARPDDCPARVENRCPLYPFARNETECNRPEKIRRVCSLRVTSLGSGAGAPRCSSGTQGRTAILPTPAKTRYACHNLTPGQSGDL